MEETKAIEDSTVDTLLMHIQWKAETRLFSSHQLR